jgi:intracellular sulfur oxidation DsrE/DsrF family protein
MKKNIFLSTLLLLSLFAVAQKDYKVVFDLTSKDSNDQKAAIRWLNEVSKAEPTAQMEVVMYGQGLDLVTKGKSAVADDVVRLAQNKNIAFKVCQVAMKAHNLTKDDLLQGVQTVPDGIYEVISKQKQGWGYIKVKI